MNKENIEGFYPLSPMQQGMLYHSMYSQHSTAYIEQLNCTLEGELDVSAFRQSWEFLLNRHTILRTSFIIKRLKEPVQIVHKMVELPLDILDFSELSEKDVNNRIQDILISERKQGFNFSQAPLFRLKLIKIDPSTHKLVWTYHHILLDGWSMPVLLQEFLFLNQSFKMGRQINLPAVRPYRDYILWIKKQDMNAAERFWRQSLEGFENPTMLPFDFRYNPREDKQSVYSIREIALSHSLTADLVEFAAGIQITVNTLIQSAWALLLARHADVKDVVFGATVAGRPADLKGAEKMLGLFINTLPIRIQFNSPMSVTDYLKEIQEYLLDVQQFEFTPLISIHGWSQVPRDIPLFNSILVFENYPVKEIGEESVQDLMISDIDLMEETNFPITVIAGLDNILMIRFVYDENYFKENTIAALLQQFTVVLEKFTQFPHSDILQLNLLTESEQQTILSDWNATESAFNSNQLIHQAFEEMVRKQPDAVALVHEDRYLTYRQLNIQANRLAGCLRQKGTEPEDLVGMYLPRSLSAIVSMLAILKCGGAYVPLDPDYPPARIAYMVQDTGLKTIITEESLIQQLDFYSGNVICHDQDSVEIAKQNSQNLSVEILPDNLAYVIYTSGSTGKPKGTLICHRGVINLATAMKSEQKIGSGDKILQFFSLSFDGSVADIFGGLLNGATVLLSNQSTINAAENLTRFPEEFEATHILLPPSLLALLSYIGFQKLKSTLSGGEVCPPEVAATWSNEARFLNAYGPTEGTVASSWYLVDGSDEEGQDVPIGRPIQNIQIYLLDPFYNLVPVGMGGEIHITGVNLARGYLNQPGLTAEKFIPNPFSSRAGGRLYKTGDNGKFRFDGNIDFLGRLDNQVKIRGYRIEIGEIESVLNHHHAVLTAVVLDHGKSSFDKQLVAYIMVREKTSGMKRALRKYCEEKLPLYMVPSHFVLVEEFPITPNGKVDKKALLDIHHWKTDKKKKYIPPRDHLELQLTKIWEEILDKKPIGVTDNFFELGGHSLLAIRLMGQIEDRFGKEIPLVQIFQEPTIEHMVSLLQNEIDSTMSKSLLVELKKGSDKQPLYFVHPSGGSVHWYTELARHIEAERPFIGIQAIGLDKKHPLDETIPAMAHRYAQLLKHQQNGAPYHLGGWSFGVIVAYELAQQLTSSGMEVETLFVIDQGPILPPLDQPEDDLELFAQMFIKNFKLDIAKMRQLSYEEQLKIIFKKVKKAKLVPFYIRFSDFKYYMEIQKIMRKAWYSYEPKPYPGKIIVVRSEEMANDPTSPEDLGWGKLGLGGVEVLDVTGDHISMMQEPHVRLLSDKINEIMKMKF